MYMSIIQLNQATRVMQYDNDFNEELVHQSLLESLGHKSRIEAQLLYRRDGNKLCVYSEEPLNQEKLLAYGYIVRNVIEVEGIYNKIKNEDIIKLFFKTVPSKKLNVDNKKNSPRIGLFRKSDRIGWVERKLVNCGVNVLYDLCEQPLILENGKSNIIFRHFNQQKNKGDSSIVAYDYVITVQVKDRDLFLNAVKNGIGPYKSYGCGLILIGDV